MSTHLETHAFRLDNMQWFDIVTRFKVFSPQIRQEVEFLSRDRNTFPICARECVVIARLWSCAWNREFTISITVRREIYVNDFPRV